MDSNPALNTRARIIKYLEIHPQASASLLSRELQRTVQDIRHHLGRLQVAGLVVLGESQTPEGRGRPELVYRLTSRARTPANTTLLTALLSTLLAEEQDHDSPPWLVAVAICLAGPSLVGIHSHSLRLNRAVRRLADMGYSARWEARPEGPRLYLDFSPYQELGRQFPHLAGLDRALIEALTGYTLVAVHSSGAESQTIHQVFAVRIQDYKRPV